MVKLDGKEVMKFTRWVLGTRFAKYVHDIPKYVPRADLEQECFLAVIEASENWRIDGGATWSGWSMQAIFFRLMCFKDRYKLKRWAPFQELKEECEISGQFEKIDQDDFREGLFSFLEELVRSSRLSEREVGILVDRYYFSLNYEDIGKKLDVSRERIRQLHNRAVRVIYNNLTCSGRLQRLMGVSFLEFREQGGG